MSFNKTFGQIADNTKINERQAVRAVILNENKLLMVKTNKGDYKFPGGGKESGESDSETIHREVLEETGYQISSMHQLLGVVLQQGPDTHDNNSNFRMISRYYSCDLKDKVKSQQSLDQYEEEQEFTAEFVTLADAIINNERLLSSEVLDMNFWVERETFVLKELQKLLVIN